MPQMDESRAREIDDVRTSLSAAGRSSLTGYRIYIHTHQRKLFGARRRRLILMCGLLRRDASFGMRDAQRNLGRLLLTTLCIGSGRPTCTFSHVFRTAYLLLSVKYAYCNNSGIRSILLEYERGRRRGCSSASQIIKLHPKRMECIIKQSVRVIIWIEAKNDTDCVSRHGLRIFGRI